MSVLVSIICPVYNAQRYLSECIESILLQSFTDFELLLIDDGSRDDSLDICNKYAQKDSRIKVYHQENKGVSSARNLGLKNSKGEYVAFIDADDKFSPNTLDIIEECSGDGIEIIKFGMLQLNDDCSLSSIKYSLPTNFEEARKLVFERRTMMGVWAGFYRRELFSQYDISFNEELSCGEDWVVLFSLYCHAATFQFVDKNLYIYRINNESITQRMSIKQVQDTIRATYLIMNYADRFLQLPQSSYAKLISNVRVGAMCHNIKMALSHRGDSKVDYKSLPQQNIFVTMRYSLNFKSWIAIIINFMFFRR